MSTIKLINGSKVNAGECFLFMLDRISSLKTLEEHTPKSANTSKPNRRSYMISYMRCIQREEYLISTIGAYREAINYYIASNSDINNNYNIQSIVKLYFTIYAARYLSNRGAIRLYYPILYIA